MKFASVLIPLACAALAGCSLSVEPGEPIPEPVSGGEIAVNWLVAGSSRPSMCAHVGAASIQVVVYDPSGRPVTRQTEACRSFSITLPLPVGRYRADVSLLDARGDQLSAAKSLEDVDVVAGTRLTINVDFPASSLR